MLAAVVVHDDLVVDPHPGRRGRGQVVSPIRGPAAGHAALQPHGAEQRLSGLVPEVRVAEQLAVAAEGDEAAEVVEPDGVAVPRPEVHLLRPLLAVEQGHGTGQGPADEQELVLHGVPLHVVDGAVVGGGNDATLLAVGAHKVQVGAPVIALAGVVHLLGGPHQQGGAGVVPLHRHRLGLEERLRRCRHPRVRDPEDLAAGRRAFGLPHDGRNVRRVALSPFRCDLEGNDARGVDLALAVLTLATLAAVARHDDHPVLHHTAAVRLEGGPLQRRPTHVSHLLHDELELHLAGLGVPDSAVRAGVLHPTLVRHQVVAQRREVEHPHRSSHQRRNLAEDLVVTCGVVHRHATSRLHEPEQHAVLAPDTSICCAGRRELVDGLPRLLPRLEVVDADALLRHREELHR
mmetsp:Transcript_17781/g.53519  ORF Transcript_17781/g.53519 Transcript_17781/m.53519 type:complete len:404 (-) Transcript_17781:127-1338(-)